VEDDAGVPLASGRSGLNKLGGGHGMFNHKKNWQSIDDSLGSVPHEGQMFSHPPHKVAPPDILLINLVRMIPRAPYRLSAMETLAIQVTDTLPNQPISGMFTISPEGTLNLGYSYGVVRIGGLTVDQAQAEIRKQLGTVLRNPQVNVTLVGFKNMEQIRGEHLVRPDGTISLGSYGSVYVAGLSLGQAKCVIERYLEAYFQDPVISLDVFAYNSRFYYIIVDGAGFGQQVFRFPITGNETVLDAISNINGLASVSSKHRLWLARPAPDHLGCIQVLPIDWNAVSMNGSVRTNYQLFPGDRIYIDGAPLIKIDNFLTKILNPIDRVFSTMFLGSQAIQSLSGGGSNAVGVVPLN
jgi:protein involved in polysaccharide export with SLBB domain